ncbi:MAG: class II aldolase/adducin family protein [Rhodospirillales bacterium]|nr:class II aldolase/adducin family protein [Rhodospirillales bacterium]
MSAITQDAEYRALLRYSAGIGNDPALVQGAGGNVSLKRDGVLWVKASGTWLAHAQTQPIMVPVALDPLLAAVARDDAAAMENAAQFVVAERDTAGLRPSIETTLHALLPHPVVVHVHCVETLAWACRADAATALAPLLHGLRWDFVPYVRPGAPLARAVRTRQRPGTEILVLGNHGLVVGAADTQAAAALVAEVARRLRRTPRAAPAAGALSAPPGYAPAADPLTHGIATDPAALAVARRGSLYPDHVIFLGPGIVETPAHAATMLVVPGVGVLLRSGAAAGAVALARCLADVTARLAPDEPLRPLTPAEESELLGWDAEQYRKALDRR